MLWCGDLPEAARLHAKYSKLSRALMDEHGHNLGTDLVQSCFFPFAAGSAVDAGFLMEDNGKPTPILRARSAQSNPAERSKKMCERESVPHCQVP